MNARFLALLAGQTGALLGAGLTAFSLGLWALSQTGSTTTFALLAAAAIAPGVVLAPFAGILAERARPRRVLAFANACSVASTTAILAGVHAGLGPGPWVYALLVVGGVGFGLQWPVYGKAITRLVSPADLGRAAALLQLGPIAQHVAAPAIAAALVGVLGTEGVLALDIALGIGAIVSGRAVPADLVGDPDAGGLSEAWAFLRARPSLLHLQLFFLASYTCGAVMQALSTPLLLTLVDEKRAGLLLSLSGVGMLLGVAAGVVVRVARRGRAVVVLEGLGGAAMVLLGAWPTPLGVLATASLFLALMTVSNALSQALWQEAVPARLQVRVFALRRMISWTSFPLCFFLVGPIADAAVAVANDRTAGIAVVFVAAGTLKALITLLALPLRTWKDLDR